LAEIEKEKAIARIKELRIKRDKLAKTLGEGQKLIFKGCYSRPLYPFNYQINEAQQKNEDWAWLTEGAKKEQQKDIVSKLLEKVTELEEKVTGDVRTNYFA